MKKTMITLFAVAFTILSYGQAVIDNAVIPVSISLNSILRLNVTSGGAIEFNVNSLNQYRYGVANSPRYTTVFTVASSVDFSVFMYAENDQFYGTQMGTAAATPSDGTALADGAIAGATVNAMPLDLVGFTMAESGSGSATAAAGGGNWSLLMDNGAAQGAGGTLNLLTVTSQTIVASLPADGTDLGGAGGSDQNKFEVQWELGTSGVTGINANQLSLLEESLEPDRYTTNVFLELRKQ